MARLMQDRNRDKDILFSSLHGVRIRLTSLKAEIEKKIAATGTLS